MVYEQIISDLTYAYETLADRASEPGRADKWSAAGYLTKVFTYLASFKMNNVGEDLNFELNSFAWVEANAMYTRAKEVTDDIIANSGFKLTEKYDYLFRETTEQWKAEGFQQRMEEGMQQGAQAGEAEFPMRLLSVFNAPALRLLCD